MQHLVYFHGFLSSPQSVKAQQTLAFVKQHFPSLNIYTPQLPGDIARAVHMVDCLMKTLPKRKVGFIGSSMGGYLATYFCEKYGGKAVLVNPAVRPFELLADYIGYHTNPNTGEKFSIHQGHIKHLKALDINCLSKPEAYKVLLQTGDETLDYKDAVQKYLGANMFIENGGDHSFVGYHKHLADIFKYLQ